MPPKRVLFLCTGNSARSQMAEAFLRRLGGARFEVFSAGLELAPHIHPLAVQAMAELGYDLSAHYVKHLDAFAGKVEFDYLITLCGHAEETCPFFPGMGTRLHWGFDDPAAAQGNDEEKLNRFRQVRDEIAARISSWLAEAEPTAEAAALNLSTSPLKMLWCGSTAQASECDDATTDA